ncbi:MAG: hypothetical protein HOM14_10070 [Gammaproteobacteria bacterium]|jgi:uncharacterized secreted protein with C-terminal beta-propeller domain|nr:hypothetical protein [Gammaproteobacteria bacterium]MBT3724549.1 hypothetical protein [Gammaproteobacteria bacterium]MBT4075732.1 hypothetical protein [Gammaproteobacteria bacterium]MBT4193162.1 hypothetical protein [Gammaproteobacteria bacterium]MBT4450297.1 hypothetical protein [Gammaproteobacteria bacterium]
MIRKLKKIFINITALTTFIVLTACISSDDKDAQEFQYDAQLKSFNSCDELSTYLLDTVDQERRLIDYYESDVAVLGAPVIEVDAVQDSASGVLAPSSESSSSIADYTSTNNQVTGVDEADFIKTEGDFTYIVTGGFFIIFDTWPAAQSEELARVKIAGNTADLFVYQDVAWVVSNVYNYDYDVSNADNLVSFAPRLNRLVHVSMFDISDRSVPLLIRETTLEGYYVDARRIDNRVHMVTSANIDIYPLLENETQLDIDDLLPVLTDKLFIAGETITSTELISDCADIYRPGTANGTGTMSVLSFDLNDPESDIKRQTIISNSGMVYANQQHLYLATSEDNFWAWLPVMEGEETPIPGTTFHKFSLLSDPVYLASGRVDGYLINQFAMDEYNDLLRAVTTVSSWWSDEDPVNSLFILEQSGDQLIERSKLTGLGKKGERIYAARFIGDKGFLVTFRQIDPLYTLDLSNPDNPRVAGELEVPGFSTYLHPLEDGLLLAIGREVESNSMKLSLFDISDFDNPALLDSEIIGFGSYSEAEYSHKAFTFFAKDKLLALPVTHWSNIFISGGYSYSDVFNGLKLYKVDRETGFEFFGEIDHSNFYRDETENFWFYPEAVRRSFFVSDTEENSFLYSISSRGMKVNAVLDLQTDLASLPLPVYEWDTFILQ